MGRLEELRRTSLDEYLANYLIASAVERELQVAIQAAIDITQIVLAEGGLATPRDYADAFVKLGEQGICPESLTQRLASMARFRNVLVHLYLDVDPRKVYAALQDDLPDLEQFARCIASYLLSHKA